MRTTFYILAGFLVLSVAPLRSAETNMALVKIDQQLLDIDIKVLLAQYEKVQKQLTDLRFEEAILDDEDRTGEQKKQEARRNRLEQNLIKQHALLVLNIHELAARRSKEAAAVSTTK
jgi:hypothetical protein